MSGPAPTYSRVEAAEKLGVSVDWLREHHAEIPHLRLGRLIRFTDAHLARIQADREVQPQMPPSYKPAETIRRRRRMPETS
jgi:hypothetical protein